MQNLSPEELLEQAINLKGEDKEKSVELYHTIIDMVPEWATPHYNLGLLHKYRGEWQQSYHHNSRAVELDGENEAAWWNLGIAATALEKWREARQAWNFFKLDYELTDEEPDQPIGRSPVRLNPDGDGEVVWCERIDPARARIENIPLPTSGHRFGDLILNDGAPMGYRMSSGKEYPVFNELRMLQPSNFHTWSVRIRNCKQKHIDRLLNLCKDAAIEAEDWSTVNFLCKQCSEGVQHKDHDKDLKNDDKSERHIGFATDNVKPLQQILMKWRIITLRNHSPLVLELE